VKVTLHNTTKIVHLFTLGGGDGMPARVWEGHTEAGIPVVAFITRIAAERDADLAEFGRDLQEVTPPTPDVEAWPAHMLID
jgi:hypothetical protein